VTAKADLREIKRRLSPRLLSIRGVSGVGLPGGKLTVYLAEDSETVRREVAAVVEADAPDTPFTCVVTGAFRPQ
jgi:hypothetical protein